MSDVGGKAGQRSSKIQSEQIKFLPRYQQVSTQQTDNSCSTWLVRKQSDTELYHCPLRNMNSQGWVISSPFSSLLEFVVLSGKGVLSPTVPCPTSLSSLLTLISRGDGSLWPATKRKTHTSNPRVTHTVHQHHHGEAALAAQA